MAQDQEEYTGRDIIEDFDDKTIDKLYKQGWIKTPKDAACIGKYIIAKSVTGKSALCYVNKDSIELIRKGQEPACVDSCMMRALKFGPMDELKAQYGEDAVTELPCFPDGGTGPNFLIKPSKAALEPEFELKET